jgi:hypothetical protein
MKALKKFRFVSKEINPSKFTEIINEANIIIVSSNRSWSRTPYIREHKVQGVIRHTTRLRVTQLMAHHLLKRITDGLFILIENKTKFILAKDLLDYGQRWMT